MELVPIDIDESKNAAFMHEAECRSILKVYPDYYKRVGFNRPWIGYFFIDNEVLVGSGGYKGKPRNGKVEIAYGTFTGHQGKGIGTEICKMLTVLSLQTDPEVRITARTLKDHFASIRILEKNNFEFIGMIWDEDDGEVCEFEYRKGKFR